MRGKKILLLSLIAMFLTVTMIDVGASAGYDCTIYVDPEEVHNTYMAIESFTIDINVEAVEDLYSWALMLDFAPYSRTLVVSEVTEGSFLKEGGYATDFVYKLDHFHGYVKLGNARIGVLTPGASGSGTLVTIEFTVVEAGSSPLNILDLVLFDSNGDPLHGKALNGKYFGPMVEFTDITFTPGRAVNLKDYDALIIGTTFTNTAEVPLMVKVRYDIVSEGAWRTFYGGQSFVTTPREPEYLYIDGYSPWLEWDWTNPGASVIGEPDGDYAESITNGAMSSVYTFEDITLGPGDVIGKVTLEGYTQYPNGPTEAVDIDVYSIEPAMFAWLGSLYGGADWGWVGTRWIDAPVSDVLPMLLGTDPTALNSMSVLLYNYEGSAADPMRVDALRLRVEFAQYNPIDPMVYTLAPGETGTAVGTWMLAEEDEGRYLCEATVWFSFYGGAWIPADRVKDFHLKIFESGPPK